MAISPPPIHERIIDNKGLMTRPFVRYLEELRRNSGGESGDLTSIQQELNNTQAGAGLNSNGSYGANTNAIYIKTATSLADADDKLDEAIDTKIISTSINYSALTTFSQSILCDATNGELTIIFPDPNGYYNSTNQTSKTIGITKVDTSSNRVVMIPFSNEKIMGEDSQHIRRFGEVLNFITDGTNWYLEN